MSESKNVIHFYRVGEAYGEFSNFSRHSIFLRGKRWPTTEHFFQAMKFEGTGHAEEIRTCRTPMMAADLGRSRKLPLRRDWESVKNQIMVEAVRTKFSQHAELKALLLSTGNVRLVEHTENDSYWGDGGDGSGKNRLVLILMQVREELRNSASEES